MPGLSVHTFDGWSREPIGDWYDIGECELVYEMWGPETARIVAPARMPYWHRARSMPGGRGVYVQVDATDAGLPLWTGRLTNPQAQGFGPDVSAELTGPREWLAKCSACCDRATTAAPSAATHSARPLPAPPSWPTRPTRR